MTVELKLLSVRPGGILSVLSYALTYIIFNAVATHCRSWHIRKAGPKIAFWGGYLENVACTVVS